MVLTKSEAKKLRLEISEELQMNCMALLTMVKVNIGKSEKELKKREKELLDNNKKFVRKMILIENGEEELEEFRKKIKMFIWKMVILMKKMRQLSSWFFRIKKNNRLKILEQFLT
jgi:hypothetical protein